MFKEGLDRPPYMSCIGGFHYFGPKIQFLLNSDSNVCRNKEE